jgi:[protein-PII] uridylyltransferase
VHAAEEVAELRREERPVERRAVDVFYVTDLTGAKITSMQRQTAIRRALLTAFEPAGEIDAPRRAGAGR